MGGDHPAAGALTEPSMSRSRISLPVPGRVRLATEVDRYRHKAQDGRPSLHQSTERALEPQPAARTAAQHFKALGGM